MVIILLVVEITFITKPYCMISSMTWFRLLWLYISYTYILIWKHMWIFTPISGDPVGYTSLDSIWIRVTFINSYNFSREWSQNEGYSLINHFNSQTIVNINRAKLSVNHMVCTVSVPLCTPYCCNTACNFLMVMSSATQLKTGEEPVVECATVWR